MKVLCFLKVMPVSIMAVLLFCNCSPQARKDISQDGNQDASMAPRIVKNVSAAYPEAALKDGITGIVWIKVLIDSLGIVRDDSIIEDSGTNVGFEESAREAARKTKWLPALENGKPIAVWITYKVEFSLK